MATLKIQECRGYTKQEAFAGLDYEPNSPLIKGCNATQAWINYGKPYPGHRDFKVFAIQQLSEKTKSQPGYGLYITLDSAVEDVRKRPYTVINNKTTTTREWQIMYLIREDELSISNLTSTDLDDFGEEVDTSEIDISVINRGRIVDQCESKAEALRRMKELTTQTHKDYTALAVKIPDVNQAAAYCIYTPGKKAREGRFIAFGYDREVEIK